MNEEYLSQPLLDVLRSIMRNNWTGEDVNPMHIPLLNTLKDRGYVKVDIFGVYSATDKAETYTRNLSVDSFKHRLN